MTAEVVVANTGGVALAADSVVTVQSGVGAKTYNSVNKLFALSKYEPVAVMIYGNAQLHGVPWETIIKSFRQTLGGDRRSAIKDYASELISYVEANYDLISDAQRAHDFLDFVRQFTNEVVIQPLLSQVQQRIADNGEVSEDEVVSLLDRIVDDATTQCRESVKPSSLDQEFLSTLLVERAGDIEGVFASLLEQLPLTEQLSLKLNALLQTFLGKGLFGEASTGLVVAGFGESQMFPAVVHYKLDMVIKSKVRYSVEDDQEISSQTPTLVMPCAQREVVDTFITGLHPQSNQAITGFLDQSIDELTNVAAGSLASETDKARVIDALKHAKASLMQTYERQLGDYLQAQHVAPLMEAVRFLPKDEVAAFAEALVSVTSIKRKVALELETVGGPIDVVVLSKGDGLIWMKRKHYFDPTLNHQFFDRYYEK